MPRRCAAWDRFDRQQRRLGLDVVDVFGISYSGICHRLTHGLRNLIRRSPGVQDLRVSRTLMAVPMRMPIWLFAALFICFLSKTVACG